MQAGNVLLLLCENHEHGLVQAARERAAANGLALRVSNSRYWRESEARREGLAAVWVRDGRPDIAEHYRSLGVHLVVVADDSLQVASPPHPEPVPAVGEWLESLAAEQEAVDRAEPGSASRDLTVLVPGREPSRKPKTRGRRGGYGDDV